MSKPVLLRLDQKIGARYNAAKVQVEAPQIAGFLPIETPNNPNATTYIALDNIASFTVLNEEACNIVFAFPVPKIETR